MAMHESKSIRKRIWFKSRRFYIVSTTLWWSGLMSIFFGVAFYKLEALMDVRALALIMVATDDE
jgi:hypothetical protein